MKCKHEIAMPDGYPCCDLEDPGTLCIACDVDKEYKDCDLFEEVE